MDMNYFYGTDEKGNMTYFYGTDGVFFLPGTCKVRISNSINEICSYSKIRKKNFKKLKIGK